MEVQACYQSEGIHPLFSLQNGRLTSVKESSEKDRFYVYGRLERCLLWRPFVQESFKWKEKI